VIGEIHAQDLVLGLQLVHQAHFRNVRELGLLGQVEEAVEQAGLADLLVLGVRLGLLHGLLEPSEHRGTVAVDRVQGAGLDEALVGLAVERADGSLDEVAEGLVAAVGGPLANDALHGVLSDAPQARKGVADR